MDVGRTALNRVGEQLVEIQHSGDLQNPSQPNPVSRIGTDPPALKPLDPVPDTFPARTGLEAPVEPGPRPGRAYARPR
jgi:hypothetical protein